MFYTACPGIASERTERICEWKMALVPSGEYRSLLKIGRER